VCVFFGFRPRFERLNATRTSVAGEGLTEPNDSFSYRWEEKRKQIWPVLP